MESMKRLFISFEGMEGSGKSTQVGILSGKLREKGIDVVVTREPGGTRIGEQIREITHSRDNVDITAASEAYLMAASRAQTVREIIRPALIAGKVVIADRFFDSSLAYQGYGREFGEERIAVLNELATDGIMPDITFFLDVTPKLGFTRRNGTKKIDRLDLQPPDFYERVYEGYQKMANKYKDRFIVVDGKKSIEDITEDIWKIISPRLRIINNK